MPRARVWQLAGAPGRLTIDLDATLISPTPPRTLRTSRSCCASTAPGPGTRLLTCCREGRICYSVGYDLTEAVRAAILQIPDEDWAFALDQDGSEQPNGQLCEITGRLDLTAWPEGRE